MVYYLNVLFENVLMFIISKSAHNDFMDISLESQQNFIRPKITELLIHTHNS